MAVDLAAFDVSRDAFIDALRRAPDVALRHRPPDEDYAVGGLVVHVIDVLERYTALIDAIRTSAWQPLTSPEGATSVEDEGLMRDGFDAVRRAGMVERLRQAHAAFSSAVAATEGDFERQADVMFAGAEGPRPTSPADVVGWVRDHYDDHAEQITSVLTDWLDSVR